MSKFKVSENTNVQLPLRNLISIVIAVAVGVWAYFGIVEKLNQHGTTLQLMESDLEKNTEFRIKWPRGSLGSLPADSEQFMMIEDLYKQLGALSDKYMYSNRKTFSTKEYIVEYDKLKKKITDLEK